jgi:hypothetical protein
LRGTVCTVLILIADVDQVLNLSKIHSLLLEEHLAGRFAFWSAPIMKTLAILLSIASFTFAHPKSPKSLAWSLTTTNSKQQFRGLSPVDDKVVWVSGTNSTVLRTVNSGKTWTDVSPQLAASENASDFQFRDIQGFSKNRAVALSIGEGNLSRIYKTDDG